MGGGWLFSNRAPPSPSACLLCTRRDAATRTPSAPLGRRRARLGGCVLVRFCVGPRGATDWPPAALAYDNELWLLKHRGLDAVVYLMVIKHLFYALLPMLVLQFAVVVPVYATAARPLVLPNDTLPLGGLTTISIQNIGVTDKERLWAPLVAVLANSAWCFAVLYRLYYRVTAKRIQHRSLRRVENYTVLVREIPRDATAAELSAHFDYLLAGQVVSVCVALKSRRLPALFAQRARALRELERCLALNERHPERRAEVAACG